MSRHIDIQFVDARSAEVVSETLQVLPAQSIRVVLQQHFPEALEQGLKVGKNGAHCGLDELLHANDRLEVYHPLPDANRRRIKERRKRD